MLKKSLIAETDAKANEKQIFAGDCYRISVLTPRLIRLEQPINGGYTDLPSQTVWFRNFEPVDFEVEENGGKIIVKTSEIQLTVLKKSLTPLTVRFIEDEKTFSFKNNKNFKGTCRTLDMTRGKTKLNDGLITENGIYVLDDSNSFLIDENGEFKARAGKGKDIYVFAYGKDYRRTICDFYKISGSTPLIPRYALGVWWSRYHRYTQKEYLDLMDRFRKENVPLTVATVDMDWHWTDLNKQFGTHYKSRLGSSYPITGGWTGYSWNTDLFPDYKAFLNSLKENNLHITLNLHPADGVRFFETSYNAMAEAVGIDPESKKDIPFVCGSDTFWNAYFDVLHKPYEREGVDFWWIDWQQGKKCDVEGLDPLIALNHYHFLDNGEDGRMPLILSRYSGIGSHRYPLGFSGDTMISWSTLDFQPYFTVNAANAAYTWWSHDIGGHMSGIRDDELYLRWIQFAVFSPVLRLHSTANDLLGKEPWKYRKDVCETAKKWLRLRHSLIPYIYTMDYRTHKQGIALCEPMYYSYPEEKEAYSVPNQYMFGSEIMVCPITSKADRKTGFGSVRAWIPAGRWTDIFTGEVYCGSKTLELNRETDSIPVLAKEGAIIPLSADCGNGVDNPKSLKVLVYSGNGSFSLYEDNGKTDYEQHKAVTTFDVRYDSEKASMTVTVAQPQGDTSVIPEKRDITVVLPDIDPDKVECESYEKHLDEAGNICINIEDFTVNDSARIILKSAYRRPSADKKDRVIEVFSRLQGNNILKSILYHPFKKLDGIQEYSEKLKRCILPRSVKSLLIEKLEEE